MKSIKKKLILNKCTENLLNISFIRNNMSELYVIDLSFSKLFEKCDTKNNLSTVITIGKYTFYITNLHKIYKKVKSAHVVINTGIAYITEEIGINLNYIKVGKKDLFPEVIYQNNNIQIIY